MKNIVTFILSICCATIVQAYNIGHVTIDFTDADRADRSVPCEIYYPTTTSGESTPFASGIFPVVIMAHGFIMSPVDYSYLVNSLAINMI